MTRYLCAYTTGRTDPKQKTCEGLKNARKFAYDKIMSGITDGVNIWTQDKYLVGYLILKHGTIFWRPVNRHKDGSVDRDTVYTVDKSGDITFYKSRPHTIRGDDRY